MKKVMRQVGSNTPKNIFDLSPKVEEVVAEAPATEGPTGPFTDLFSAQKGFAEEVKVEETEAQPVAEAVVVEEHTHDENCDHPAEEQAPKRSRKKQAEPSDAE